MNYLRVFCLCLLILNASCAKSISQPDKPTNKNNQELDVFLLIGQSNMQGVAPIGSLDTLILKNVYLFNDKNKWEPARNLPGNGMNRYSTVKRRPVVLFGPAYTFGRKIAAYTGRQIGIVSNARGATRIEWWQKGYAGDNDFNLYEEAVARAKAALAANPNAKLKGILWHQGEADYTAERSAKYVDRLKALVKDLRKDLGDPHLPFIAGEVGKWNNRGLTINPLIRDIKSYISDSEWVSSDGLTSIDVDHNNAHFDNLSQRVFGERYADKAAWLVYKIKPDGATLFSTVNYQGRSVLLSPGSYSATDLESMGIRSNEIISVKVDKGYKLLLDSRDGSKTVTDNIKDLKGYIPSSVKLVKQ